MALWLILAALSATAALIAGVPLLRGLKAGSARRAARVIYHHGLADLDRERKDRLMAPATYHRARTALERQVLRLGRRRAQPPIAAPPRHLAAGVIIALPLAALILYALIGRPDLPGQPIAERGVAPEAARAEATAQALLDSLAGRLETQPDDLRSWVMRARTALRLRRFDDALAAYSRAMALSAGDARIAIEFAEARMAARGGLIDGEAVLLIETTLSQVPDHPAARYYLGLALAQRGRYDAAIATWRELAPDLPERSPLAALVAEQIARAESVRAEETGPPL